VLKTVVAGRILGDRVEILVAYPMVNGVVTGQINLQEGTKVDD
jgi:hypothetical protein